MKNLLSARCSQIDVFVLSISFAFTYFLHSGFRNMMSSDGGTHALFLMALGISIIAPLSTHAKGELRALQLAIMWAPFTLILAYLFMLHECLRLVTEQGSELVYGLIAYHLIMLILFFWSMQMNGFKFINEFRKKERLPMDEVMILSLVVLVTQLVFHFEVIQAASWVIPISFSLMAAQFADTIYKFAK